MYQLIVPFLFTLLLSCNVINSSRTKSIIGSNDLQDLSRVDVRAGILQTVDRQCNAVLVGQQEIASALHCVGDDPISFVGFQFTAANGQTSKIVDIKMLDDKKDFVIYVTDRKYEIYFSMAPLDPLKALTLIAVSPDSLQQKMTTCRMKYQIAAAAAFTHDCDTISRFSGAPLLQDDKLVGIHMGTNQTGSLNYAINLAQLQDDEADIVRLEDQVKFEWPHVRSPHIRSPHLRTDQILVPVPIGITGYPMWGDRGGACGSGFTKYLVPDDWGIPGQVAHFSPACEAHDRCYDQQLGKSICDSDMLNALKKICRDSFRNDVFVTQRLECENIVSNVYYVAVKEAGEDAYKACSDGKCL